MPIVCGVELKSSDIVPVVLEQSHGDVSLVSTLPTRLSIEDDESTPQLKTCFGRVNDFLRDHCIDVVVIKKRARKGRMAGGAISFKLEALIQMNTVAEVVLLSPQAIAAAHKKTPFELPVTLKAYQENAYLAAALYLRRS